MSKLDLTTFEDTHMTDKLVSGLVEIFRQATGKFPESLKITEEQGKKFFLNANEIADNFKGIPLEIEREADHAGVVLKTIDNILKIMHTTAVKDVAEVYRALEQFKEKVGR